MFSRMHRGTVVPIAGLLLIVYFVRLFRSGRPIESKHLKVLMDDLTAGKVAHLQFGNSAIIVLLQATTATLEKRPAVYGVPLLPFLFHEMSGKIAALIMEQKITYSEVTTSLAERLQSLVFLLPIAYLGVLYYVMKKLMNPKESMKKSTRVSKRKNTLPTFADVAGIESAKVEMRELVSMLRSPVQYKRLGAQLPRGYLLVGPSGTGKTLLAKAVAGEANAAFFQCSASDFVETLVGRGAARVRELFERAAAVSGPAIVFIDELDALGKKRGQINSHDEREQTLNQLLTAMDGFESRADGNTIVVMAATNRVDVLDPALIRPGRFDTHIHVGLCDAKGREAILRVHLTKIRYVLDLDIADLASRTRGFSGADLAALVQDATRLAARRRLDEVTEAEFDHALERAKMRFGSSGHDGFDDDDDGDGDGNNRNGRVHIDMATLFNTLGAMSSVFRNNDNSPLSRGPPVN